MATSKLLKWVVLFGVLLALFCIYKFYDPDAFYFFPKCPFRQLTGMQCPGCGSQRALHHLFNLEIGSALRENILLVLSIPYLFLGFVFDLIKEPSPALLKWRQRLFGQKAILIILFLIIAYWILRNAI